MKKLSGFLIYFLACLTSISQTLYKTPMDLVYGKVFTIPGNLNNGPFDTKIQLEENDFVFVEAVGKIKVGDYLGYADPTGLFTEKIMFKRYFKYYGIKHGSLIILTGGDTIGCKQIFYEVGQKYNNPFTPEYPESKVTEGTLRDYIPGYYFISKGKSKLLLDINDTVLEDNTGTFTVKVYIIKFKDHLNRNYFNYCPIKEPETGKDAKKLNWAKENPAMSAIYHGAFNSSYRGSSMDNIGCQCVYGDFSKTLVLNEEQQGSFDLGYWIFKGKPELETTKNYYHLVLDVIPHDLYVEKFGDMKTIYNTFKSTRY